MNFEAIQLNNQVEDAKEKAQSTGEIHYVVWSGNHFSTVSESPEFKNIEVRVYPGGRMEALGERARRITKEYRAGGE